MCCARAKKKRSSSFHKFQEKISQFEDMFAAFPKIRGNLEISYIEFKRGAFCY